MMSPFPAKGLSPTSPMDLADWLRPIFPIPANPTLLGSHPVPGVASGVTLADGRAYVADAFGGIQVFDVTNPELPVRVAASNAPVRAWSSAIGATGLFAADSEGGLIAFDAANFTPLANNLWLFH